LHTYLVISAVIIEFKFIAGGNEVGALIKGIGGAIR
jgi:hypothetical protein